MAKVQNRLKFKQKFIAFSNVNMEKFPYSAALSIYGG